MKSEMYLLQSNPLFVHLFYSTLLSPLSSLSSPSSPLLSLSLRILSRAALNRSAVLIPKLGGDEGVAVRQIPESVVPVSLLFFLFYVISVVYG